MKYISSNLLTVGTSTGSKLRFLNVTRPRRSEVAPVDTDDFAEAIDCRLISPVVNPIEAGVTLHSLVIVRLGFKIRVSDDVKLSWIRFQAKISRCKEHSQSETLDIHSFIPKRIEQDLVLGGRIILRDDGSLKRDQVSLEEAGTSATSFKPFSLGYKIDASHVIWDFLPFDGSSPTSTDKLVIAVDAKGGTSFQLSQSLQLCATHQKYQIAHFEYPTEIEIIKLHKPGD